MNAVKEQNENGTQLSQFIVIRLGSEQYGIDIRYVDNIVRMQRITRIPKAQPYFKGVINLRGEVIPVMSLRIRFDLEDAEPTNATRIIIIKLESQSSIGLIVDEVKEVVTLYDDEVEKPTTSKDSKNDEKLRFLLGVGKHGDTLISLLNIANVVEDKEK